MWCDTCGKGFAGTMRYRDHMRQHKGLYHYCEVCGRKFVTEDGLGYHMNEHIGNYKHRCDLCGRGFNKPSEVRNHKLEKHAGDRDYMLRLSNSNI